MRDGNNKIISEINKYTETRFGRKMLLCKDCEKDTGYDKDDNKSKMILTPAILYHIWNEDQNTQHFIDDSFPKC